MCLLCCSFSSCGNPWKYGEKGRDSTLMILFKILWLAGTSLMLPIAESSGYLSSSPSKSITCEEATDCVSAGPLLGLHILKMREDLQNRGITIQLKGTEGSEGFSRLSGSGTSDLTWAVIQTQSCVGKRMIIASGKKSPCLGLIR